MKTPDSKPVVLLTGASSGLGRGIANLLLSKGWHVIGVGRNTAALGDLGLHYPKLFTTVSCDLENLSEVKGLVEKVRNLFPHRITHFIHSAGFAVSGEVESLPLEEVEACLNVNYLSAVSITSQLLPAFKTNGGSFSFIGSGVARRAIPFYSPYCSAKAALLAFSDSLRVETQKFPVHILYFSPGPVSSGFQTATRHYGRKLPHLPFNGKKPIDIAKVFTDALYRRKKRVFLGANARIASHLNHLSPSIIDWVLGRLTKA